MAPSTADIRAFISQHFGDVDLDILCFDYFPAVKDNFTTDMPKAQKIQLLLEYAVQHSVLSNVLGAVQRERPQQYAQRFPAAVSAKLVINSAATYTHNARQIFISHAKEDAELAQRLADDLLGQGWPTWIAPNSIVPGEHWADAINRGLEESGIFVLLLTPHAVASRWVRTETNAAMELEHQGQMRLIPLDVQPCSVPVTWNTYQRVNFRGDYTVGLAALLASLGGQAARSTLVGVAPTADVQARANMLNEQGVKLHIEKDYDGAITIYSEAIALDPSAALYYRNRGVSYHAKGNYDAAIADFNQAIKIDPIKANYYKNRSGSYHAKGNYDAAIADDTQAIKLDPNNANDYRERRVSDREKGNYDAAIADFNQAIKLDPNVADYYRERGVSYHAKGNCDAAIADFNQAIKLDPNVADYYRNRGVSYHAKGNYDAAIADHTQALKLRPNDADYYFVRGQAYQRKGQKDKARADFEQAHVLGDARAAGELAKL